jgi:diguanylate cyclase (GGDEF)-like protein/PAS domain S-box-containing protein
MTAAKEPLEKIDVLVVDDERINLKLMKGILADMGLNIVTASSGEETLQHAEEHDFAVVLLDVMMPGLDGFATAELLRGREKTCFVPIIFVTAISVEQHHVFQGYETGAVDYLIKPVEPEILKSKVRVFVDLHRQKKALEEATRRLKHTVEELSASKAALETSEQRYRTVADYNYDWETWIDPRGRFVYVSPSCERISGYPPEKFIANPRFIEGLIHKDDLTAWRQFMDAGRDDEDDSLDFRLFASDTRLRWINQVKRPVQDTDGTFLGFRCSLRDITDRKRMELELRHQALHDPLTGIANRTLCLDRIRQALVRAKRAQRSNFAVIFLDIDRFKVVNDSLGHPFGDKLLVEVARRLSGCVRAMDTVSRFGGDEYVIFLEDLDSNREAVRILKRIRDVMREPFLIDEHEIVTTVSLGIALGDAANTRPEDLIQASNIAMYQAKASGRNRFRVFNTSMREQAARQLTVENDLRRALARGEFALHYQPIVSLKDGGLVGFEALVRWNHPDRGLVSPGEFIPVAEETGLIVDLGHWVLDEACSVMSRWRKTVLNGNPATLAVNISGRQFAKPDFVDRVKGVLARTKLDPSLLKLEITETAVMDDARSSAHQISRLKDLGLLLSIDDFGTGYSSMSYLQKFPLDMLKIDLSFVKKLDAAPENIEIVRAIIHLAHSLNLKVVAEGIERKEQQGILYSLQCEFGQGYLFSKPLPLPEAEAYIRAAQVVA